MSAATTPGAADDLAFPVFDPLAPLPSGRLLIEASAGTGKTHTITTLAVRFVAEVDGVGAAGLCVVSFTEAATAELRSRIRQRMVDVADALDSGEDTADPLTQSYLALPAGERSVVASRLRRATEEFDRAIITTIHGFCSRVLTALGVDVGAVGPGGDEVAEVVNDLLLTAARPLAGPIGGTGVDDRPEGATSATARLDAGRFRQVVETLVQLPLATMDSAEGPDPVRVDVATDGPPADEGELQRQIAALAHEARRLVTQRRRDAVTRSFDSLLTDVRNLLDPAAGATEASLAAVRSALGAVRVVMVDEFQDTDGLQWAIFDNAFPAVSCPMVLVGDPKQSIYRFRSAELSAYLAARSSPSMAVATLGTNYRSDPGVLSGLERLYVRPSTAEAYVLGRDVRIRDAVHFRPVAAHHEGRRLDGMDLSQSVELRVLDAARSDAATDDGATRSGRLLPTALRRAMVVDDVARQVSRLLRAADPEDEQGRRRAAVRIREAGASQGWRDLQPSDIAVLVRSNDQALAVAHRLGRSGIAAATATTSSVLDGAAAWQWRLLLAALARPASSGPARAAALGWFLGIPATDLADPEADLASVHAQLAEWASVLRRGGPIALLAEARRSGLADRLLERLGGERRITDIEHIAELLHAAVGSRPAGALEVAEALDELAAGAETEGAVDQMARRIDRDDEAVQVLTVHRAKGLEFPVVLCPFLWPARKMDGVPHAAVPVTGADGELLGTQRRVWTPWAHRCTSTAKAVLGDFWLDSKVALGGQSVKTRQKLEHLEETDRLAYVALTRAAAHLVVWWVSPADARGSGGKDQALARLLAHATGEDTATLVADPMAAVALDGDHVAVRAVDPDAPEWRRVARPGATDLERARYTRSAEQPWQRWSYSSLSAQLVVERRPPAGGAVVGVGESYDIDPDEGRLGGADERPAGESAAIDRLPDEGIAGDVADGVAGAPVERAPDPFGGLAGTRFGTMVHGVLERIDFTSPSLAEDLGAAVEDAMAHWRAAPAAPTVAAGLASALAAPLGGPLRAADTRLCSLAPSHRLNELRFDLALGPTTVSEIADVLADDPRVAVAFGAWLDRLRDGPVVTGMLTGSIDLVGTFDGDQYWVADHKTNLLAGGYGPAQLVQAMADHDYPLQATLYLVALHRFLGQRLVGYDPGRHLAGAAYLFVRGMAVDGSGIHWFTPAPTTVVRISDLLAREAAR